MGACLFTKQGDFPRQDTLFCVTGRTIPVIRMARLASDLKKWLKGEKRNPVCKGMPEFFSGIP